MSITTGMLMLNFWTRSTQSNCALWTYQDQSKRLSALKPEETYLIAKYKPLLNNRTKLGICTEALQKYKCRIGIVTDYQRDDSGEVELEQKYLDMCDLDLELETDPCDT